MQNKKNKCVAFLVTSINSGGIENYLYRYLMYDNDIEAILICKSGETGELEDIYIKRIGKRNIIKLKMGYVDLPSMIKFHNILKKNNVECVCDFTGNFAGIPLAISYFAGVKKRITFYRGSTNHFNQTFVNLTYNSIVRALVKIFSTKILSNSISALDFFYPKRDKKSKKYKVIYNGIPNTFGQIKIDRNLLCKSLGIPPNGFIIGNVGRYNQAKNHKTIIKVAEQICKKYDNIYFILVGKDVNIMLIETVKQLDLFDRIKLLGVRDDVEQLLKIVDLFYFPSVTEGQPNALIEAMVSGVPILASDISPIRESVPGYFISKLISPTNIDKAVLEIEKCISDKIYLNSFDLKDWAAQKYKSTTYFEQFKQELV